MRPFILKFSFLFMLIIALHWTCKSSDVLPKDYVVLAGNQSARLGSGITVRADTILDSRCPEDVLCITAGFATANLSLTKNNKTESIKLWLGYKNVTHNGVLYTDSTVVSLGNESFNVILRRIDPYPNTKNINVATNALVQVTKL